MAKRKYIQHTAKIADVPKSMLHIDTVKFFQGIIETYTDIDPALREDLYDEENILEAIQWENEERKIDPTAMHEAERIYRELKMGKFSFLRLTNE